jgi:flagellar hook-associated protein 2
MAIESIAKTLGTGSGIDITALVTSLVEAQYEAKNSLLTAKSEKLASQISAAGAAKSNITSLSTALASLVRGGTLRTVPTSSDTGLLTVSALSGVNLSGVNARVEVRQLAAAQSANTAPVADKTAAIGTGKLRITLGTATVAAGAMSAFTAGAAAAIDVTITSANNSLEGIAAAINAAGAGVTASILSDSDGARLVLKGANGAASAFTMTATEDVGAEGLADLNVGIGASTTIGSAAADAIVAVDGVQLKRTSNSITDLVPGIKLELVGAAIGTTVRIGSTEPTASLTQAADDFVSSYNEVLASLKADLDPVTGSLRADNAAKTLARQLAQLTLTPLVTNAPAGAPGTLAGIGITTNRDGSLSLDSTKLSKALINFPDIVEAMFAEPVGTATTGNGLSAAMNAIATAATSTTTGLGASESRYTAAKADLTEAQERAVEAAEATRTRMTLQFAKMDAKVAAYKTIQTSLQQQIDAWNAQDS